MSKKIYLFLSVCLILSICTVLTISGYDKYSERKQIEAYMSRKLNLDIMDLISLIEKNHNITEEILETNVIQTNQLYRLTIDTISMMQFFHAIEHFEANIKDVTIYMEVFGGINSPRIKVESIRSVQVFCNKLKNKYDENNETKGEEILVELDDSLRKQVEIINHLYKGWINAVDNIEGVIVENEKVITDLEYLENYYGKYSINSDYWVDFIRNIEEETRKTLRYFDEKEGWSTSGKRLENEGSEMLDELFLIE
ncbi:hypothetical protein RBH29_16190 [Herbivorax sp. ANBcel31]|uniref:hypothetical protein n=1 Tax=Herbivorax sp. ANBcel31 TaxID=3069754 RepID=UPI0027B5DE85|nr:hypothetical protein [Herbivorax sp. ANBcel31]MDQ2087970.1 hypothetical protein [Herbivorax sp. ANBcel31]